MKVNFTIDGEAKGRIWKEIPGFENYLASNDGKIFNKKRNKELKQSKTKDGYLKVSLYKHGKSTTKKTHIFIAQAFIPNYDLKPCVNHIDCDRTNNNVNNLEWVTHKENAQHALKNNRLNKNAIKENNQKIIEQCGMDYFKNMCRINGKKADAKKGQQTREKIYGKETLDKRLREISEIGIEKISKKTAIFKDGKCVGEYKSITEAAKYLNSNPKSVSAAINKRNGNYKGYKLEIIEGGSYEN